MAVTQEQLQDIRKAVSDTRVDVATLTGALNVTNDRLNNLINSIEKQGSGRRWAIGTFLATLSIGVAVVGTLLVVLLHL